MGNEKEEVKKDDLKKKKKKKKKRERQTNVLKIYAKKIIFDDVQMCSLNDPCILTAPVFRLMEEAFNVAIQGGPTHICGIYRKLEY